MSSFFCLARAHVHIGPHLSFTPREGRRVRVTLGIIGILWIFQVCLSVFFHSRGTVYPTEVTVQRRGFCDGTDITGDVQ